jgi:hypothetical protein
VDGPQKCWRSREGPGSRWIGGVRAPEILALERGVLVLIGLEVYGSQNFGARERVLVFVGLEVYGPQKIWRWREGRGSRWIGGGRAPEILALERGSRFSLDWRWTGPRNVGARERVLVLVGLEVDGPHKFWR